MSAATAGRDSRNSFGCAMTADALSFVSGRQRCFAELEDPRVQGRCEHLLLDILGISLLAVLCGADDWTDIEEFGLRRHDFLAEFLA